MIVRKFNVTSTPNPNDASSRESRRTVQSSFRTTLSLLLLRCSRRRRLLGQGFLAVESLLSQLVLHRLVHCSGYDFLQLVSLRQLSFLRPHWSICAIKWKSIFSETQRTERSVILGYSLPRRCTGTPFLALPCFDFDAWGTLPFTFNFPCAILSNL